MIVLLEPPAAPGFVSGGYRYQQRVFEVLAAQGRGRRQSVAADELATMVAALQQSEPAVTIVVDGLFAELAGPLPEGVTALLHMVPKGAAWHRTALPAITTSARTADQVAASCTAVAVVRPGVDACFRRALAPRPADAPLRLVIVGTLCEAKGQLRLIEALTQFEPTRWQLDVIGSDGTDAYAAAVRSASDRLPVRISGPLTSEAVAAALADSDLLVSMSRDESFGMAAVEAATMGLPVLAFDTGEIAAFVRDGDNGWLLAAHAGDEQLQQRLEALLLDPGMLAARRGRPAAARAATWPEVAEAFAAACAELAPHRHGS